MKKKHSLLYLITAFVFVQLAWFGLLGLWIYWYVANYLIFEQVGDQLSPQLVIDSPNVLVFVLGIVLMVAIEVAMLFAFRNLTVQMKLTNLYDNFIGNVSHELKSPLSSIQLFLETLSSKDVTAEKRHEFYAMMQKDAERLKKLINSILEISKLEQKSIAHNFHIYNAEKIIKELVNESAGKFRLPENALQFEGSAEVRCVIDKEALQIVFDNLMSNSVKYSPKQPKINFKLASNDSFLTIEVTDNGIGILPKDLKKIFEKFQRITNPNIPNVKGTGLGLYWAKQIIKFHGGKISAASEGIGKGTTFKIKLPVYHTSNKSFLNSLLRKTVRNHKQIESSSEE